jgi:hypothetical protein
MTTITTLDYYGHQTVYVYDAGVSRAALRAVCPLWFWLD